MNGTAFSARWRFAPIAVVALAACTAKHPMPAGVTWEGVWFDKLNDTSIERFTFKQTGGAWSGMHTVGDGSNDQTTPLANVQVAEGMVRFEYDMGGWHYWTELDMGADGNTARGPVEYASSPEGSRRPWSALEVKRAPAGAFPTAVVAAPVAPVTPPAPPEAIVTANGTKLTSYVIRVDPDDHALRLDALKLPVLQCLETAVSPDTAGIRRGRATVSMQWLGTEYRGIPRDNGSDAKFAACVAKALDAAGSYDHKLPRYEVVIEATAEGKLP